MNHPRLSALKSWFAEARYAGLSIAVIAIAAVISLRQGTSEPVIRLVGLVLQLLGICTVIWGISETRKLFSYPTLASKAKNWIRSFPLRRRDIVLAAGVGSLSAVGGRLSAYVTHGPGDNPTTESRLDALEKNITALHGRISETMNEMDHEFRKATEALKHEEQTREAADATLRKTLEEAGTGGIHISEIGVSWLLLGVILSTAAPEISALLK